MIGRMIAAAADKTHDRGGVGIDMFRRARRD
jgi:hypothetical protein